MKITQKQAMQSFLSAYPRDPAYRPFADKDAKRLKGKIPPLLLSLAEECGWCSFNSGMLWLCDPDDWKSVADAWLPSGRGRTALTLRTAFGEFVALRGTKIWLVLPHSARRIRLSDDPNWVFGTTIVQRGYDDLALLEAEQARAAAKCGAIDWRTMYNYAPAVALGGSREDSELAVEDMTVALDLLSQVAPITGLDD